METSQMEIRSGSFKEFGSLMKIWRTCIGVIEGDTAVLDGAKEVRFSNQ